MINLFLGISLMFFMCILEILILQFKDKKDIPWRDTIFNLNSGHVILWFFRGCEVSCFDIVSKNFNIGLIEKLPVFLQWIFVFFAWDFCFYWMHRIHHKYKILWAVHVVHHEGEHFNSSLGIRNSWYSSLTSFPFFAVLAVIGVTTKQFYLIGALHYFIQFYNHNSIIKKHGFLDRFIVSPSHHKIHHASNKEYRDKNCGGTLTIWDKWFDTYQEEKDGVEIRLGVPSSNHEIDNPLIANNFHLFSFLNAKRTKIRPNQNLGNQFNFIVSLGGFLLFGLLISYIYYENKWSFYVQMQLFWGLVLGTYLIYGLFEDYKWAKVLWLFFGLLFLSFLIFNNINNILLYIIALLLIIHSTLLLFFSTNIKNL